VGCSVLQCVAVCCRYMCKLRTVVGQNAVHRSHLEVLQCVAVCCSLLQCVAMCCSVLQCVVVCDGVATIQWLRLVGSLKL